MYGVIYVIINLLNGMRYVGQTRQPLKKRMYQHSKANSYIGNAIRHYGWKNFTVEVLEECDTLEQLNERERFWIAYFNCKYPNGYNLTDGGDGLSSLESQALMSTSHTGKTLSEEHKSKIGKSIRGKKRTQETRDKMSIAQSGKNNGFFGKHHTPEAREKIGAASRGKKSHFSGKHQTPETKSKLSAANRGNTPFKNLLNELDKRQMSYGALAKLLGLSKTTVSNKMLGRYNFTAKDIAKLVEIFGLPAEHLMARDD